MMKFVIFLCATLIMITLFIDIISLFLNWLSRIHIGRNNNIIHWREKISNETKKALIDTPNVKVSDNTRLIFLDVISGNYRNDNIQYWQEAALLLGVIESYSNYNKYDINAIDEFLKRKFDNKGDWKKKPENIDCAILSYAVMNLDDRYMYKYRVSLDYT